MENHGIELAKVFDKLLVQSGGVTGKRLGYAGFSPKACYSAERFYKYLSPEQENTGDANASPVFSGAGDEARLHFGFAKIIVLLRQAVASNSPPDCCI